MVLQLKSSATFFGTGGEMKIHSNQFYCAWWNNSHESDVWLSEKGNAEAWGPAQLSYHAGHFFGGEKEQTEQNKDGDGPKRTNFLHWTSPTRLFVLCTNQQQLSSVPDLPETPNQHSLLLLRAAPGQSWNLSRRSSGDAQHRLQKHGSTAISAALLPLDWILRTKSQLQRTDLVLFSGIFLCLEPALQGSCRGHTLCSLQVERSVRRCQSRKKPLAVIAPKNCVKQLSPRFIF